MVITFLSIWLDAYLHLSFDCSIIPTDLRHSNLYAFSVQLVGRLSQDELMAQLPSFLPALFEAFGNQSADVRKVILMCLFKIFIILLCGRNYA